MTDLPSSREVVDLLASVLAEQFIGRVLLVDASGVVLYANLAARSRTLIEQTPSVPFLGLGELLDPVEMTAVSDALQAVVRDSRSRTLEVPDFARTWAPPVRWTLQPVLRDGAVPYIWLSAKDGDVVRDGWSWCGDFPTLAALLGRVAQDFNELLVSVLGGAELARHGCDPVARRWLDQVLSAGAGAVRLTSQLRAIAGSSPRHLEPLRVADLAAVAVDAVRSQLPASLGVTLRFEPGDREILALGDPALMHAAFAAVLDNAVEAVSIDGGEVRVRVLRASLTLSPPGVFPEVLRPGRYAVVEVEDDGPGVPPSVRRRLFEPFASTKTSGRGLGLPVTAGVLHSLGGGIQMEQPSGPTRFRVFLPEITPTQPLQPSAIAHLLVVSADPAAAMRHVEDLAQIGHRARHIPDPLELAPVLRHLETVDAVLLDLDGSHPSPVRIVEDLRAHGINVPVLVVGEGSISGPGTVALARPVTRPALAAALAALLNHRTT